VETELLQLDGRSAIITGANQGLGRAIAAAFVRAGAGVLLVARGEELLRRVEEELTPLAVRPGQRVQALRGDVADPESCNAVARRAAELWGGATILVNNAAVTGPIGHLEEVDAAEWMEAVRINLFGTALMCRAVIPNFRERGYGKIINLSGGGATGPRPRFSAYAAAKAAVVRLTETLAEELRGARVDVNAIAPGALNTRMLDDVLTAGPEKVGREAYEQALKQRSDGGVPLEKGVELAVFLASAASDGISGRLLSAVWDDWVNLPRKREQLARSDVFTLRRIVPEDRKGAW
jgi:NAD(P)-dependent dehydrogenase (short-subunit alcohol dehydrogenase family)